MLKRLLFFLVVIALVFTGGYYLWGRLQETVKVDPPQLIAVKRGMFVHEVLERGNVDSAQNTEIRCRVEGASGSVSGGGLSITFVVDEGTLVEEGDLLVELESASLSENVVKQRIVVLGSTAKLEQSRATLKNAELSLTEYLEGTYKQNRKTIENELFAAEETVRTQEDTLSYYQKLLEKGYITDSKVEADLIELQKAENAKEIAEMKLLHLDKFTKPKNVTLYETAIITAKAEVEKDEETLALDLDRLKHWVEQVSRCTIYAPREGQVVYYLPRYATDDDIIREGKRVREREILLLLPDPTQMQVKGLVNEANIRLVKPGQRATIRLEAFPNQVFDGVVKTVNDYPEPGSFFGNQMSREYMTIVTVLNPPQGIKTGLTAEARIVVSEIPNALLLPIQAVFEYGGKMYAVTYNDGVWDKIEIKTGRANDKEVVILEGLNEGDVVVLGAWAHRDRIDLPQLEATPENGEEFDEEMFLEHMRREETQRREGGDGGQPRGGGGEGQQRRERPTGEGGGGGGRQGGGSPGGGGGGPRP